jgi:hypothetical protein
MKKTCLLVLALGTLAAGAQKVAKPDAFAKTITPADMKKHLYTIAGPEMEGRETATAGQRKAAAYIEAHFRSLGLLPGANGSYQQLYNVYQDSLLGAAIEVNGTPFALDRDFGTTIGTNISGTFRFSEVTFVSADTTALKNADLSGKLVIMFGNNANVPRRTMQLMNSLFRSKGIAGILTVSTLYPRTIPAARKGGQSLYSFKRTFDPQQYQVSENIARAILGADFDAAKAGTLATKAVAADISLETRKTTTTLQSSNVVAVLPGTDLKDEYLFVTGHYDHLGKRGDSVIYYGADDDGSGTVGVMEIAEAFAKAKAAGKGPRRTMVFMTVSGEEKGLWGSEHYSNHPLFPLEKTTADLNIDMIGRSDVTRPGDTTNYIYVVGDDKLSTELKPVSEAMNKKYTKLELDYKYNDPNDPNNIYFRSDHYNFARKGVPIIFYYDGMLGSDYHKPTDTPDKIHYELMAKRAQLVFFTAWEMANRNEMMKRDIPLSSVPGRRN